MRNIPNVVAAAFVFLFGLPPACAQTVYLPPLTVGGPAPLSPPSDDVTGLANVSTDAARTALQSIAIGDNVAPVVHFDKACGTPATPTACGSGTTVISIGGRAWNSSNGFGYSSAAFVCKTVEATSSGQQYTGVDCTIGTTAPGSGLARQDTTHFDPYGNVDIGSTSIGPHYSGFHSLNLFSGSAGSNIEFMDSGGTSQATFDLNVGNYMFFGSRASIPVYIAAAGTVGITLSPSLAVRFNGYGAGALVTDGSGNMSAVGGASCSGAPSSSFAVNNGVVTHC